MIRRPPRSPLFPSTTLFRSAQADVRYHPAEARRPHVVARVGGDECDGRGERAGPEYAVCIRTAPVPERPADRKSTRLNSSHSQISYAVFCLKKKRLVY